MIKHTLFLLSRFSFPLPLSPSFSPHLSPLLQPSSLACRGAVGHFPGSPPVVEAPHCRGRYTAVTAAAAATAQRDRRSPTGSAEPGSTGLHWAPLGSTGSGLAPVAPVWLRWAAPAVANRCRSAEDTPLAAGSGGGGGGRHGGNRGRKGWLYGQTP